MNATFRIGRRYTRTTTDGIMLELTYQGFDRITRRYHFKDRLDFSLFYNKKALNKFANV